MSEGNRINLRHILRRRRQAAGDAPPAPATDAPTAGQVNALISTCKTNWFLLMSYLAFVGVTLIGVVDLDFFMPERRTELPLIGVTIPTALFFYIAPVLGVMLFAHLHFYLMRLWRALSHPGAPDAGALNPRLVVDYALHIRGRDHSRFPLQWLADLVVTALIFWATPIVLTMFWWRSMPKHDGWLTLLFCGGALFLSVLVWAESWWVLHHGLGRRADRRRSRITDLIIGAAFVLIPVTGFVRAVNMLPPDGLTIWPLLLASAQLQEAVFVETPADWLSRGEAEQVYRRAWCEQTGIPTLACGPGPLTDADVAEYLPHQQQIWCDATFPSEHQGNTAQCRAEFEKMAQQYEAGWEKARADALALLPRRDLSQVDLRGADLWGARMEGAVLREARMERADLWGARMDSETDLTAVDFSGAAVRSVDYSSVGISQEQVDEIFGDASVTLPPDIIPPPHWPRWELEEFSSDGTPGFYDEWQRWRDKPGAYTLPPKPAP